VVTSPAPAPDDPPAPATDEALPAPVTETPASILGEVVVRLGERVLDVQHVGQRPEPAISSAGLFTLGACAAGLGLWLVASDIAAVADESAAAATTASTEDPAVVRSEPTRGGAAGLGALLILLGVIPAALAAGRSRPVPTDRYMIGEGPAVNLPIALPAGLDGAGIPLLLALERQLILGLVPGMSGEIHHGDEALALADLVAQGRRSYALPAGARCDIALGLLRFEIQAVAPEPHIAARRPLDRLYWASNLGALTLIGGLLWIAEPPATGELEVEEVALHRARALQFLGDIPPPKHPPKPPPEPVSVPKARPEKPAASRPAPAPAPPELAVIEADTTAPIAPKGMRRGIRRDFEVGYTMLADEGLDAIHGNDIANTQESLLAFRDSAEDRQMWADVLAAPVISRPLGGLELAETERGGGVHDDRPRPKKAPGKSITIDALAKGKSASAEERALARRVFKITFETPFVRGELSTREVQDGVRQQEGGLRRCFKEAVGTSDRVGTVIFRLQIAGTGRVSSASLDYGGEKLGDIGPCVARVARAWRFPPTLDHQPATAIIEAIFSARTH